MIVLLSAIAISTCMYGQQKETKGTTDTATAKAQVKSKDAQEVYVLSSQDLAYLESVLSESNLILNGKALSIKEGVGILQWLESRKLQVPEAQVQKKK